MSSSDESWPNAPSRHVLATGTGSAPTEAVLGVDIGTTSSKGVLVSLDGRVLTSAMREHAVDHPVPGQAEMDARTWWNDLCQITHQLRAEAPSAQVTAIGVSGMGPCVLVTDSDGLPLRPAILYGIDTRAAEQIDALTQRYSENQIRVRCGSALSTQAVGPKLAWLSRHEPDVFARSRRLFMPSSYLTFRLTGHYLLDHHSASQSVPLYDLTSGSWYEPWWADIAGGIEPPLLRWPGEVAGRVTRDAAAATGLPADIPVVTGTVDAWAESVSVHAQQPGELTLMYGTTMFLIHTLQDVVTAPSLWTTAGVRPGTYCVAGGMATSGAITSWLNDIFGRPGFDTLTKEASASPVGSNGLLLLPYFAGERTPIADPQARGILAGLTVSHTRGDLYRAALEGTAFGVRHNIEAMRQAGCRIDRVVAVGGGTQGGLWTQIVSDATGLPQSLPRYTVGASYGMALLAAQSQGAATTEHWNPTERIVQPNPQVTRALDERYQHYLDLYQRTADTVHALVRDSTTVGASYRSQTNESAAPMSHDVNKAGER